MMPFAVFEHTADVGMRVTAASVEQLFGDAGRAVASLIVENVDAIELRQRVAIELEAEDVEGLFVDWLREYNAGRPQHRRVARAGGRRVERLS